MSAARDVLAGVRVCLVTPGHPSTNPRVVKEADALHAAGARVRLVHGRFLAWAEQADAAFEARGWRREAVPFGPRAGRATWLRQGIAVRGARLAAAAGLPVPPERGLHPVAGDLAAVAAREPADVFIGHNLAGGVAAARAAARHGALLGFDAEDDHVGELPDAPGFAGERARRRAVLDRLLPACAHLTAASPRIAATLAAEHGRQATPVLNVFPRAEADAPGPPGAGGDTLYWVSQTIGPARGLEQVVDVLPALPAGVRLLLRGQPQPGYLAALRERLAARGADPARIEALPPSPPDAVTAGCRGHALVLSTELAGCRNRADCLTNKIFHGLLAGTPVLLSDTPAQRELARELGPAALCTAIDDREALAARLRDWLGDPAARAAASAHAGRIARERYCWEVEQHAFLDTLRAALARGQALRA